MVVKIFRTACVVALLLGCRFAVTSDFWRTHSAHDQVMRKPAAVAYCTLSSPEDDCKEDTCNCGTTFSNFMLGDTNPWQRTASGFRSGTGTPARITWSIVPDGTTIPGGGAGSSGPSVLNAFMSSAFTFGVTGEALIEQSFNRWGELSGVTFVRESNDDGSSFSNSTFNGVLGVRGDIRIGGQVLDGPGSTLAFNFFPNAGGDMVLDTSEFNFFRSPNANSRAFRNVIMHELGHAIGLNHVDSSSDRLLLEPSINLSFDGPQLDEVRAVQFIFGDAFEETNNGLGNGTVARATDLGSISPGDTLAIGTDADVPTQTISSAATDFVSISSDDDVDVYSFTVTEVSNLDITLTPHGGVFAQGAGTFDADSRVDLALSVIDSNGQSVLASSDQSGLGGTETVSSIPLEPGTYFTQITGVQDTIQLYSLELTAAETPVLKGDVDLNGVVNFFDVAPFILVLQNGFQAEADVDCNGSLDFGDIPVFIAILQDL